MVIQDKNLSINQGYVSVALVENLEKLQDCVM